MKDKPLPYAIRAEVRAVEEGHKSWKVAEDTYEVVSDSTPGLRHRVTRQGEAPGAWIIMTCTCPAGQHATARREGASRMVPCKHAALVGRRLEREGVAVWNPSLNFWTVPGEMNPATAQDVFDIIERMENRGG